MSFRVAGARDCGSCQKWAKHEGFVAFPKTMAGMGHLKRICKDACRVAGAVQKTCSWERLGGQGADFLRGFAFWSIRSVRLLRWFCVTGAALRMNWHQFFEVGAVRSTLDRWSGKIAKRIGTRPSALHSTFHFWRKPRRIVSFLTLLSLKTEEVSQNCFVFDVVNFEEWRSLAELLRFWRCQVQTLRKSRTLAAFLMLSTLKNEEVSQNCFVFGTLAVFLMLSITKLRKSRRIASFLTLSSSNIEKVSHTCCVFDAVKFKTWGRLAE